METTIESEMTAAEEISEMTTEILEEAAEAVVVSPYFFIIKGFIFALLGITFVFFIWAYTKSKNKYDEYIEPLDKAKFKMKEYFPIGLFLSEKFEIRKIIPVKIREMYYRYNDSVKGKIIEIYGMRFGDYYYAIHIANKWFTTIFVYLIILGLSAITCATNDEENAKIFLGAAFLILIGMPFLLDYSLDKKVEEKRLSIQMDFPEFINKLVLLVNAGMTVSKAWEKIVIDNKKDTPLYMELNLTMMEIEAGKAEVVAYEEFARRCKVKEVIKCVSIIILNLKKGGGQIVPTLRAQADECWEMRKATARRLGEQASSKLMLPMAIMLLGIIMVVVLPAILSLTDI